MLFNTSERKGVLVILLLIIAIIVVPRQLLPKRSELFLLPAMTEIRGDSIVIKNDSIKIPRAVSKYKRTAMPQTIELNKADSASLVKIRGIGPYYASKIIHYRERLGGYESVKQLKELNLKYFNADSCARLFTVDPSLIRKSDMDTMNFKAILRHPYLEYEDVQMIFKAKQQFGHLSYAILEEHKILAAHKLKKIKPYFK